MKSNVIFFARTAALTGALTAALGACGGDRSDDAATRPEASNGTALEANAGTLNSRVALPAVDLSAVADSSAAAQADQLFDAVSTHAETLAQGPWVPPDSSLSAPAAALDYAQYRDVRYREEATLWRDGGPFRVQLFHPGSGFRVPVALHLVEDGRIMPLAFDTTRFSYGDELGGRAVALAPQAGHAGFRILHPINDTTRWDEVAVFLGASYYRLLGPQQIYGLSARGLAVGVASPDGEEFPDFTAAWLVRPAPQGDDVLHFVTLLDGPSVTGAYRFALRPGTPEGRATVLEVRAQLFARQPMPRLGFAPLTSMYLHGTFRPGGRGGDDVRPRVHDSEGLLMQTAAGESIWRPLTNRRGVNVTSLRDTVLAGFGLLQRTRSFDDYLDLEALYHRRPSVWVEALGGDWGEGGVELVELPSPSEFNDNIVAYWAPGTGMQPGDERTLHYRLMTFDGPTPGASGAQWGEQVAPVVRTRVGWDALPGQADPPPRSRRRAIVDFAPHPSLAGPLPEPRLDAWGGSVGDVRVQRLPDGGVRVTFAFESEAADAAGDDAGAARPVDLRVWLMNGERQVSETWSWLWRPDDDI